MQSHDPQHRSQSPLLGPDVPRIVWRTDTQPGGISAPVVAADGTVYAIFHRSARDQTKDTVVALSPLDGSERARLSFDHVVAGLALEGNGTLIIQEAQANPQDDAGAVWAVNEALTVRRWSLPCPGSEIAAPTVGTDGALYFACDGIHQLFAVDPSGNVKWKVDGTDELGAIGLDGTLFAFGEQSQQATTASALSPINGRVLWRVSLPGSKPLFGMVDNRGALDYAFTSDDFHLESRDAATGNLHERLFLNGLPVGPMAVGENGTRYIAGKHIVAYAVDGNLAWLYGPELSDTVYSIPVVDDDGTLFVLGYGGRPSHSWLTLASFTEGGQERFTFVIDKEVDQSPTALIIGGAGRLYAAGTSRMYAIDGTEQ